MNPFQSFLLGLIQGLTEFLPVSSSAHLKCAKILLNVASSEESVFFDLVCHLGTLAAVLYFFRKEILALFTKERKLLALLCIATLPLLPFYVLLKPLRDFASAPKFLGICWIITGGILFLGGRLRIKRWAPPSWKKGVKDALWIGTLQAAALLPGISRSASTISCARVLGWHASDAVKFSFLLSIPTVIGGSCVELIKILYASPSLPVVSPTSCAIGFLTAMGGGLVMIRFAITFLQKGNLKPFAWYCLVLGGIATLMLW